MSRFFDSLRLANNLEQDEGRMPAAATPVAEQPSLAELEETHAPGAPAAFNGNGSPAVAVAAAPAPVSTSDPWRLSPEDHSKGRRSRTASGLFTALARTAVDNNVRIIPNAVDRIVVEHYRRLRTKLMQQYELRPFRSLLITSASPQEGKSVTALNLGLSFAMLPSFRVLVVDGDMRRNTIGKWLKVADRPGFSNLIEGTATVQDVVFTCEDSPIHFISGGTSKTSPAELLHSSALPDRLRELTSQFDLVLIDSPPVNLIADAQLLAAHTDAVVLVARTFKTAHKSLEKAVQDLQPFRVIGTVLNAGTKAHLYRGYSDYY